MVTVRAWKLSLGLVAALVVAGCQVGVGNLKSGSSGSADAGDASGGAAGSGGGTCFPGPDQKICNGQCEKKTDPYYGCAATDCTPCSDVHGTPVCATDGQCGIVCDSGWGDCDKTKAGCETNTQTDPKHCGHCGNDCFTDTSAQNWDCDAGVCTPSQCAVGKTNCGGGLCTDVSSDAKNCGVCGHACAAGQSCQSGQCVCPSGQVFYNGSCCTPDCGHGTTCGSSDGCGGTCTTCTASSCCTTGTCTGTECCCPSYYVCTAVGGCCGSDQAPCTTPGQCCWPRCENGHCCRDSGVKCTGPGQCCGSCVNGACVG